MSTREEIEKCVRQQIKLIEEDDRKSCEGSSIYDTPGFRQHVTKSLVEIAIKEGLTIEQMKNGTKKYIQEMNCENYQTINPTELTLIYDFWTTVFRLSKHKEWIDLYEICEEIKKPEYVEDWFVKIFIFVYYAEDENILEIDRGNGKFRLIPGKKLSLIKQLIEQLGRPDKKYNDH